MGALDFLMKAMAPAAEAVGSYSEGQEQESDKLRAQARQSKLDDIENQLKQSQMSEDKARANWFNRPPPINRNIVPGKDGKQYLVDENGIATPISGPDGPLEAAPKARTATLHSQIVDPTSKKVMNLYNDGSMEPVRDATESELARANKVPRDPNDPAPELPDVATKRKADNTASAADRVVQRFLGQNPQLAGSQNLSRDMEIYLGGLQRSGDADAKGLALGDINSALGRRVKPPSATDVLMQQAMSGGPPPAPGSSPTPTPMPTSGAAAGAAPSSGGPLSRIENAINAKKAAPAAPAPGSTASPPPTTPQEGGPGASAAAGVPNDPRIQKAADRIRNGKASVQQLDQTDVFTPAEKAAIKQLLRGSVR